LCLSKTKSDTTIWYLLACEREVALRWINTRDFARGRHVVNGLAERTGSTPNIEPTGPWWDREPGYKLAGDHSTPTAYIRLVGCTTGPRIFPLRVLHTFPYLSGKRTSIPTMQGKQCLLIKVRSTVWSILPQQMRVLLTSPILTIMCPSST